MGQHVLIVDSTDGTGKTSIAQEISRLSGVPYFKNGDEHRFFQSDPSYFIHAIRYVDPYFARYLGASGASVILDRAYPSEWVYSQALGRSTDMAVIDWLDRFYAQLGAKIFMPYRTSYDHLDDYDVIKERIWEIDGLYAEFAGWTRCPVLRLCVDGQDLDGDAVRVLRFMRGTP